MSDVVGVIDHLGPGGAQRQFSYLMSGLAHRGHRVRVVKYYPDDFFQARLHDAGIDVVQVAKNGRFDIRPALEISRRLRERRNSNVIAFLSTPALYCEVLRPITSMKRLIVSERSAIDTAAGVGRWLKTQLHRSADFVVANSRRQANHLQISAPHLSDRVSCIYNGYPDECFSSPGSIPDGEVVILALGKVNRNKNPLTLAAALVSRRQAGKARVKVKWAGEFGSEQDGNEIMSQVNALLDAGDVLSDWEWLGLRRDVSLLLDGATALYNGSYREGLSNSVCEAFCRGVPVIASNISDHEYLVGASGAGWLFDPDDVDRLEAILDGIVGSCRADREQSAAAAYGIATRELTLSRMVSAYEELLCE